MLDTPSVTELRLRVWQNGYLPLPLQGKRPDCRKGWQNGTELNEDYIRGWERDFGYARNTGILARSTVLLDLDVLHNEACADAMEAYVREHYGERGTILVRTGLHPKRGIPFQTDTPFKKIQLIIGQGDKIEVLADGQQWAAFGVHPDTHEDYSWAGDYSPFNVKQSALPRLTETEFRALVAELGKIASDYGYDVAPSKGNGDGSDWQPADIEELTRRILSGEALHDSVLSIAGSYAARNAPRQDCLDYIGLAFTAAHQPRYGGRWDECKKAIAYCYAKEEAKHPPSQTPRPTRLTLTNIMDKTFEPLKWVVPLYIPEGCTLFAGKPKVGKSWLMLATALAAARSDAVLGEVCPHKRVLYCALEDTERRLHFRTATLIGQDREGLDGFFVELTIPRLGKGCDTFLKEYVTVDKVGLIIIDTLAAIATPKLKDETQNACDYRNIAELTKLSHDTGVDIIIVHHLRKQGADDPFDQISGTLGLAAAADHLMTLSREGDRLRLATRGRDADPEDKIVEFDSEAGAWNVIGDYEGKHPEAAAQSRSLILSVLGKDPVTPAKIKELTKLSAGTVYMQLKRMLNDGLISKTSYGTYTRAD